MRTLRLKKEYGHGNKPRLFDANRTGGVQCTPKTGSRAKVGYGSPESAWKVKKMLKKRRKYSAQFEFEIALEAAKELKTIAELSNEHGVHPNQISLWKRQLIEQGTEVFGHRRKRQEAVQAELFEQID
jgi:hypothetical protein